MADNAQDGNMNAGGIPADDMVPFDDAQANTYSGIEQQYLDGNYPGYTVTNEDQQFADDVTPGQPETSPSNKVSPEDSGTLEREQRLAIAGHEKVCTDIGTTANKVKPIRFNFELRETTPVNSESDTDDLDPENDGLVDPTINRQPEVVKVFEEDENGVKFENKRKSYKLEQVKERLGCFINLDEKYYSAKSIE